MYYLKTPDYEMAMNFIRRHFPLTKKKTYLFGGIEVTVIEDSTLPDDIIEFWNENPPKCVARYKIE